MILLEQFKHDPPSPCWEAKAKGDPLLATCKFVWPPTFKPAPWHLNNERSLLAEKVAADVFHKSSLRLDWFGKLFYIECSHNMND